MPAPRQLEYRALNLLEALAQGRSLADADATAAAYRRWPGPASLAARRLAAHANVARGRDVLWLIGMDTTGRGPGAEHAKFAAWLDAILPFFDGLAPQVTSLKVPLSPARGKTPARFVVALHVETSRAPFVVRGGGRRGELAVPWLESPGGTIRPAGRLELIKLLTPLQDLPQLEVLEAELTFYKNPHASYSNKTTFRWTLDGSLYLVPQGDSRVIIPLHRCRSSLAGTDGSKFSAPAADINFTADKNSPAVRLTDSAILVEGLGRVFVYCSGSTHAPELPLQSSLSLLLDLLPAGSDRAATASTTMRPAQVTEGNQAGRWKL